jgi:cytochrome c-type biogenesis protein CcmH
MIRWQSHSLLTMVTVLVLACAAVATASEPLVFEDPKLEARFDRLTEELRCLVCQNQSLADSDAQLAQDLRNEVFLMLEQGNSDEEIKRFLVDRYGDFVLYRPPVRGNTLLLWLAPILLLTAGAVIMAVTISRRRVMLDSESLDTDRDEDAGEATGP